MPSKTEKQKRTMAAGIEEEKMDKIEKKKTPEELCYLPSSKDIELKDNTYTGFLGGDVLDKDDSNWALEFIQENQTNILPEFVKSCWKGVEWKLIFTYRCSPNPSSKGNCQLSPMQLASWRDYFIYQARDRTGYLAAEYLAGSWTNWRFMLENNTFFSSSVSQWVEELNALQASGAERLMALRMEDSFAAAKYFAAREYDKKDTTGVAVQINFNTQQSYMDDLKTLEQHKMKEVY